VPRVVNHAALDSTVKVPENAQNALLDSTKVRENKPPASNVKTANYQTQERQPAKKQITKWKKIATTTTNTSTAHLLTQTVGHVSHVHLVPLVLVTLHGIKSLPSTVIGD